MTRQWVSWHSPCFGKDWNSEVQLSYVEFVVHGRVRVTKTPIPIKIIGETTPISVRGSRSAQHIAKRSIHLFSITIDQPGCFFAQVYPPVIYSSQFDVAIQYLSHCSNHRWEVSPIGDPRITLYIQSFSSDRGPPDSTLDATDGSNKAVLSQSAKPNKEGSSRSCVANY